MEQRSTPMRAEKPKDIRESLGKLPPSATDLEEAILGALMLERNAMMEIADILKPSHFYSTQHKEIFDAIIDLFRESQPVDMRTVVAKLRKNGKLEAAGGAFYIAELTSKISSAANIEHHARIVVEYAIKREMIQIASTIHHDAYEDETDAFQLKDKAMDLIDSLTRDYVDNRNNKTSKELAYEALIGLQARMAGHTLGIPTGYEAIDRIIFGWQPGHLIIVGGRPGMAKSTLTFESLYHLSHDFGIPSAAFSLEMPSLQAINRLACSISEIDAEKIKKGKDHLTTYEFERFNAALGEIAKAPMFIDDTPALHITDIRARTKRLVQKHGVKIILVDYIQLARGAFAGERLNRDQEIGNISRGLKAIAKENNIPVIAISSLSRSVETRGGDKRPILADLRESGNLESDADTVAFMYRPEIYHVTSDENGMPTSGLAEFIVLKHRDGGLDTAKLKFTGRYTKFSEWTQDYHQTTSDRQKMATQYKNPSERLPSQMDSESMGDSPF